MTKKMDEIFNIETIVPDTKVTKDIEVIEESIDIDTDYKYARENLYNIIETRAISAKLIFPLTALK